MLTLERAKELNAPHIRSIQSEVLTARRSTPIRTVAENIHALFGYTPEL